MMKWSIKTFDELSNSELYEICKSRYEVFACEQKIYQENDFDGLDKDVYHLFLEDEGKIVAYTRIIPAGMTYDEATFGRVLVLKEYRRRGIAKELVERAIDFIINELKKETVVISAQLYVKSLYELVGFKVISDTYSEVDIPHVTMKFKKEISN